MAKARPIHPRWPAEPDSWGKTILSEEQRKFITDYFFNKDRLIHPPEERKMRKESREKRVQELLDILVGKTRRK